MQSFDLPRCSSSSLQYYDEAESESILPEPRAFCKRNKAVFHDSSVVAKFIRTNRAAVGKEIIEFEPAKWTTHKEQRLESARRISMLLL